MTHHKLYIAFDVNGEPFAVSPNKDSFRYHDPERVREFASKEVAECIVDGKVNLMVRVNELQEENDKLRGIIAKSSLDCMYCGLPKADMAKCAHGFPGCGRADDMMVNGEPNGPQSEPAV